jgi:hypothetical protein
LQYAIDGSVPSTRGDHGSQEACHGAAVRAVAARSRGFVAGEEASRALATRADARLGSNVLTDSAFSYFTCILEC